MVAEIGLILAAYLVGSIPLGYTVARLSRGIDLREYGTGNVGASNVYRNVGRWAAVLVAVGDILKGLWPMLVSRYLMHVPDGVAVAAGLAAIVGYGWPIFMRFKGGRGLATSMGVCGTLIWPWFILLVILFLLGSALKRVALLMVVAFAALPLMLWWSGWSLEWIGLGAAAWLLLLVRRLDGVGEDLDRSDRMRIVADRLLFDRSPGQRLIGPIVRTEAVGPASPQGLEGAPSPAASQRST